MPYWRLFYHLVWTTKGRQPIIVPLIEPFVHRILAVKCYELGGQALAVNGIEDHVHVVAVIPPKVALAEFVGNLKGNSSRLTGLEYDMPFEWQDGYGAFTVSERSLQKALDYVRRQKEHHQAGTTIQRLEHTSSDNDGPMLIPPG